MVDYRAEPTPERPTVDARERRFVAGKQPLAGWDASNLGLFSHIKNIVDLDA
jgi:hypothetical protein